MINTKVKVRSPDGDTDDFDIVPGVLQGDTLATYLSIIWLDYALRTTIDEIKENGFKLTKERSRRYPAKTITDADYADDIAFLANATAHAETLLHSLERATAGIGLHIKEHKIEYIRIYKIVGEGATPFPGLFHFTFDAYLTMLSVKQGGVKYHFLSLGIEPRSLRPLAKLDCRIVVSYL